METTNEPATKRQTWALFCATGKDFRNSDIDSQKASLLLRECSKVRGDKKKAKEIVESLLKGEKPSLKAYTPPKASDPETIFQKAHAAGMEAGNECENHGMCGFAWITVRANSKMGKYLVKKELGRKNEYEPGVTMFIHEFGQSGNRKFSYAAAFAAVLKEHGIKCDTGSRDD